MQKPTVLFWVLVLVSALLAACATGISKQAKERITFSGAFTRLREQPQEHIGQTVLLGGKVIQIDAVEGMTEMIILQLPLNRWDRPVDADASQGRFMIRSGKFIDPAVYPAGTRITMVGRLVETQARPIGEMVYHYPVFEPFEIKKWPPADSGGPRFHFGIGVGTSF